MNATSLRLLLAFAAASLAAVTFAIPGCGTSGSSAAGGSEDSGGYGDAGEDVAVVLLGADAAPEKGCPGYPGQNPATLPGSGCCTTSPSHCVPKTSLPASIDSAFVACGTNSSGLCVPDNIIEAGSEYVPTSCATSILEIPLAGVCLSECITLVSGSGDESLLKQETCATGELCVPCVNPLTKVATGACSLDTLICGGDAGTGGGGTGDGGTAATCPYTGPQLIDPTQFPQCSPTCAGAHCIPSTLVPASEQSELATCTSTGGAAGVCAPDTLIASAGESVPPTCVSVAGAEGRCLSTCLPAIASEAYLLPQSTCAAGTKCAPCYDPVATDASAPTGACSLACDKPTQPPTILTCPYTGTTPVIDPTVFPACSPTCAGAHCVPASLVPSSDQSQLATCTSVGGAAGFCAPDSITEYAGDAIPTKCTSIAGAEGRCLSKCLPEIAAEAELLPQANCTGEEVCAPCYNPTSSTPTTPTGACNLGCDKPSDPPTVLACPYSGQPIIDPSVFPDCSPACAGAHCVPASLVSASDAAQLSSCTSLNGAAGYCAPDSITEYAGESVPPTCTSIAGAEGRCLSTCLPAIAAEASLLPQATCATGQVCAPCYDPVAANPTAPTGACSLGCDKPADPPTVITCPWFGDPVLNPATLPACDNGGCSGAHCLPKAEVPASVQSQLTPCDNGAGYCTPDEIISTADNFIPPVCDPFPGSGLPGRCLSECLPAVQSEASTLVQSTCTTGQLCVPCNDPFNGKSTGACDLGCDTPPNPPVLFPTCCNDGNGNMTGTCVPAANVPSSEQSELNSSGNGNSSPCPSSAADYLCVPDTYLPAPYNTPIQGCEGTIFNICGVCLSECIVQTGISLLTSSTCPANSKCLECALDSSAPGCSTFCP